MQTCVYTNTHTDPRCLGVARYKAVPTAESPGHGPPPCFFGSIRRIELFSPFFSWRERGGVGEGEREREWEGGGRAT